MEAVTEDILTSVLSDEFKVAVEKKDKIIAALDKQIGLSQDKFNALTKEIDGLSKKVSELKDTIILAYHDKDEALKTEKENFEKSKANSVKALDDRENGLEQNNIMLDANVKKHQDNVSAFNKEKLEFSNRKKAIIDTLRDSFNLHSSLLQDAIKALREPYQEPVQESVQAPVETSTQEIETE